MPENIMFVSHFTCSLAPVGVFFIWNFLFLRDILVMKQKYSNGLDIKFSFMALGSLFYWSYLQFLICAPY